MSGNILKFPERKQKADAFGIVRTIEDVRKLNKAIEEKYRFLEEEAEKEANTAVVLPCGHTTAHIMESGDIKCAECGKSPIKVVYEKTEGDAKEWYEVPIVVWGVMGPDDVDIENTTLINPNPEVK